MTDGNGKRINELINEAAVKAREETAGEPDVTAAGRITWPVDVSVGHGLEGAIACETKVGYVNGKKGQLIYRGYDIFDLCANSTFEEVSFLLLHGRLPTAKQFERFNRKLIKYRYLPKTMRMLMGFPVEEMNPMAALRLGTNFMRQQLTWRDMDDARLSAPDVISSDEDTVGVHVKEVSDPADRLLFEMSNPSVQKPGAAKKSADDARSIEACIHLISGMATLAAGISRLREGKLPLEPDPELGHAANYIYMTTGERPTAEQERVMDVSLILHADHGMNASTFASLVVASTLSDIYFSIGSGIAALNGPLHGGANEQVIKMLQKIGSPERVPAFVARSIRRKEKIMGFGHRVYKAYDPRARILGPLAESLCQGDPESKQLFETAKALENEVLEQFGREKGIFPNVDFYSGLVYRSMGIPSAMNTPIFAVSRVSGWSARVLEYLQHNRIFRPRAQYVGKFGREYLPLDERKPARRRK
jgi:citrate synthase